LYYQIVVLFLSEYRKCGIYILRYLHNTKINAGSTFVCTPHILEHNESLLHVYTVNRKKLFTCIFLCLSLGAACMYIPDFDIPAE